MVPTKIPERTSIPADNHGVLLMPPTPPEPGTIRILIGQGCTWTSRDVPGATQLDIRLTPRSTSDQEIG